MKSFNCKLVIKRTNVIFEHKKFTEVWTSLLDTAKEKMSENMERRREKEMILIELRQRGSNEERKLTNLLSQM